ncbi:hypothetical protein DQE80_17345, partial [Enterococcus sp. HPCN18]
PSVPFDHPFGIWYARSVEARPVVRRTVRAPGLALRKAPRRIGPTPSGLQRDTTANQEGERRMTVQAQNIDAITAGAVP